MDIEMINGIKVNSKDKTEINPNEQQKLLEFIDVYIAPFMTLKNYNTNFTSYGLKHITEDILGFYVSNYQFKVAMAQRGFEGKYEDRSSINCYYKLSNKQYKKLQELR